MLCELLEWIPGIVRTIQAYPLQKLLFMPACAAVGTPGTLIVRILVSHAELIRSIMQIDTALTLCAVLTVDAVEQHPAVFACNAPYQLSAVPAGVAPGTIRAVDAV